MAFSCDGKGHLEKFLRSGLPFKKFYQISFRMRQGLSHLDGRKASCWNESGIQPDLRRFEMRLNELISNNLVPGDPVTVQGLGVIPLYR
jgi:hypothetical protein